MIRPFPFFVASGSARQPRRLAADRHAGTRLSLTLIVLTFGAIAVLWALGIPIPRVPVDAWSTFNPDEASHLACIQYLVAHGGHPAPFDSIRYEAMQPPLYYFLAAPLFALFAPLFGDNGAVVALRLVNIAVSMGTILLVYRAGRLLLPRGGAVLASAVVAGVPMFVSLSAAITNEPLTAFTATGALYVMLLGLKRGAFDQRRLFFLSLWVTAGIATRLTCLGLIPAAFLAIWWAGRGRKAALGQMAFLAAFALLGMGWWFARNTLVYGDPLMQRVQNAMWNGLQPGHAEYARDKGFTAAQYLALVTEAGWDSFWGTFDAMRAWLPPRILLDLLYVQGAALIGFGLLCWRGTLRGARLRSAVVLALASSFVLVTFYRYNWDHYTPQGRYLFGALLPFGLLMASGWRALFPARIRGAASLGLMGGIVLLNVYCLLNSGLDPQPNNQIVQPGRR